MALPAEEDALQASKKVERERDFVELHVKQLSGNLLCSVETRPDWMGKTVKAADRSAIRQRDMSNAALESLVLSDGSVLADDSAIATVCEGSSCDLQAILVEDAPRASLEWGQDDIADATCGQDSVTDMLRCYCVGLRRLLHAVWLLPTEDHRAEAWLRIIEAHLREADKTKAQLGPDFKILNSASEVPLHDPVVSAPAGAPPDAQTNEGLQRIFHGHLYQLEGCQKSALSFLIQGLQVIMVVLQPDPFGPRAESLKAIVEFYITLAERIRADEHSERRRQQRQERRERRCSPSVRRARMRSRSRKRARSV